MDSTVPSTAPTINARRPRVRRWLRIVFVATLAGVCLVLCFVVWSTWGTAESGRRLAASEVWARQATLALRAQPGGEKLIVRVPRSMRSDGWSFSLSVGGFVLDEHTDARLHAAFDAMEPPKDVPVRWGTLNCSGDAELFNRMEAAILEDEPEPAK